MSLNLTIETDAGGCIDIVLRIGGKVNDSSTIYTYKMVVWINTIVEAIRLSRCFDLQNAAFLMQEGQIPVHRTKADVWEHRSDICVDRICCWMLRSTCQVFNNGFTLSAVFMSAHMNTPKSVMITVTVIIIHEHVCNVNSNLIVF